MTNTRATGCVPVMMTPAETAKLLGVSVRTLRRWRAQQHGPSFVIINDNRSVRYSRDVVLRWRRARTTVVKPPRTTKADKLAHALVDAGWA